MTDRRLVILGIDNGPGLKPTQVLWEAPREVLGSVVKHAYAGGGADVSLMFSDGSWARLRLESTAVAIQLVHELCPPKRVEMTELALKKLKSRAEPTKLEHTWEAVSQDDGSVLAQRVMRLEGRELRGKNYQVTKWIETDAAGEA